MATKTLGDIIQKGERWDIHDSISLKGEMSNPSIYYQMTRGKHIVHIQQF